MQNSLSSSGVVHESESFLPYTHPSTSKKWHTNSASLNADLRGLNLILTKMHRIRQKN